MISLNTKNLIDNYFDNERFKSDEQIFVPAEEISQCGIYIINSLPGYVFLETKEEKILITAKENGYIIDPITNEISNRKDKSNENINRELPEEISKQIKGIINNYMEVIKEEPKVKIKRFKVISA